MIYLLVGIVASAAMLLYRTPPHRTSPLWAITTSLSSTTEREAVHHNRTASFVGITVSFSLLFFISALRYGIGTDYWARYAPIFDRIKAGFIEDQETGFVLLNNAAALVSKDYQGIFVLTSFLTTALFFRFFLRMSLNPALSVYIYVFGGFYLEAFNLVQQGLAIAILLNTVELALRNKHVSFVLMTLLATSIHTSAFVWFAVWPLMWFKFGRSTRILMAFAMIALILFVPQTVSLLVGQIAPAYSWYFESNYGTTRAIQPAVVAVAAAVFIFVLVETGGSKEHKRRPKIPYGNNTVKRTVAHDRLHQTPVKEKEVSSRKKLLTSDTTMAERGPLKGDRYVDAVVNILAVSTALLVATLTIAYLFSRLNYYFAPIQMLAVPLALSLVRAKSTRQLLTFAFMLAYMASFVFQFIVWNAHGVLPYQSIFSR